MALKVSTIGSIILPLVYVVSLIVFRDPDFLIFILGPLGFVVWIVQHVGFLIGSWPGAVIATMVFLALVGYLFGRFLEWVINKIRRN